MYRRSVRAMCDVLLVTYATYVVLLVMYATCVSLILEPLRGWRIASAFYIKGHIILYYTKVYITLNVIYVLSVAIH